MAKINSVGLRLTLKELKSSDVPGTLLSTMLAWKDLPCTTMFPSCDIQAEAGDIVQLE